MPAPQAPRRTLPAKPSHEHLRKQAKRLAKMQDLKLAAAQRRLAVEYGYPSWAALMRAVDGTSTAPEAQPASLSIAAIEADEATMRTLLARGEPADGLTGDRPLWHVCTSEAPAARRVAVARLLLEAGASTRWYGKDNTLPLHQAARRGPLELVELLIRHGALSWQADGRGRTALDHARKGTAPDRQQIIELLDRPVIRDKPFREAVSAIHAGNLAALSRLLDRHPNLLRERASEPDCYPQDYFRDPRLFWFIANNPTLTRKIPANIVEIGRAMIARGVEQADLDYTLELVMSSGSLGDQQAGLITLLIEAGATATPQAIRVALAHWELEPILLLLARGMAMTAPIAAALGRTHMLASLLPDSSPEDRQEALGLAVINRQLEAARLCLDAGADPNSFLPVHRHSTPLHQAAINSDIELMKLLVMHGARLDIRDTLWDGTPLNWAVHGKKAEAEAYLRSLQEASG
jgi:Ankyrin repeats (many copies)/Ankyrin repeats (3 copies)